MSIGATCGLSMSDFDAFFARIKRYKQLRDKVNNSIKMIVI